MELFNQTSDKNVERDSTTIDLINYNKDNNYSLIDMPVYFEDVLEFGEELTIENCQLSDALPRKPIAADVNKEISLNNFNQPTTCDEAGVIESQINNNKE